MYLRTYLPRPFLARQRARASAMKSRIRDKQKTDGRRDLSHFPASLAAVLVDAPERLWVQLG